MSTQQVYKFIDACSKAHTELLILDRGTLKSYDQAYQVFKILELKQAVVGEPKCSVAGVLWELGSHGGVLVQSYKVWVGIRVLGSKKLGVQSNLFMHFWFWNRAWRMVFSNFNKYLYVECVPWSLVGKWCSSASFFHTLDHDPKLDSRGNFL